MDEWKKYTSEFTLDQALKMVEKRYRGHGFMYFSLVDRFQTRTCFGYSFHCDDLFNIRLICNIKVIDEHSPPFVIYFFRKSDFKNDHSGLKPVSGAEMTITGELSWRFDRLSLYYFPWQKGCFLSVAWADQLTFSTLLRTPNFIIPALTHQHSSFRNGFTL